MRSLGGLAVTVLAMTCVLASLLGFDGREESFSLGQRLHVGEENADLVHSKSASELESYAGILYGAPVPSTRKRSIWTDKKVSAELHDAALHDKELSRYQGILSFPSAPSPRAHQRALRRGRNEESILDFGTHQGYHHDRLKKRKDSEKGKDGTHAVEGSPTADDATAAAKNSSPAKAAQGEQAILIRPPPAGESTDAITSDWKRLYSEAQSFAGELGSPARMAHATAAAPRAAAGDKHDVGTALRSRQVKGSISQFMQERCSDCSNRWSKSALDCIRQSCTSQDDAQLEIDDALARTLAIYLPDSEENSRTEVLVPSFTLPTSPASTNMEWVKVSPSAGLSGLGIASGQSSKLSMGHRMILSAADLKGSQGTSLLDALAPLVKRQQELNKARGGSPGESELVTLQWGHGAVSSLEAGKQGPVSSSAQSSSSSHPADSSDDGLPSFDAPTVANAAKHPVSHRPAATGGEKHGVDADADADDAAATHDTKTGVRKSLEEQEKLEDSAVEDTLVRKEEELEALQPQEEDAERKRGAAPHRAATRLTEEVAELEKLEKREETREGAIAAERAAEARLLGETAEEKSLADRHARLERTMRKLNERLGVIEGAKEVQEVGEAERGMSGRDGGKRVEEGVGRARGRRAAPARVAARVSGGGKRGRAGSREEEEEEEGEGEGEVAVGGAVSVSGPATLSEKEVGDMTVETGVLEGLAKHARSLVQQVGAEARGGAAALERHRARVVSRDLEDVREGLHAHAALIADSDQRSDMSRGGSSLRAELDDAVRETTRLGPSAPARLGEELHEIEGGLGEVSPVASSTPHVRMPTASAASAAATEQLTAATLLPIHRGVAAAAAAAAAAKRRASTSATSSLSSWSPQEHRHTSIEGRHGMLDQSSVPHVSLSSSWSQQAMRAEGRDAEEAKLKRARSKLLVLERALGGDAYKDGLGGEEARLIKLVGKYAEAQTQAGHQVREALGKADGVFSLRGGASASEVGGKEGAVAAAIMAARRAELEAKAKVKMAKEVAARAGKAAERAEAKGGIIPGIGYVRPEKENDGILSEIFNPTMVPARRVAQEEEGEAASMTPPEGLGAKSAASQRNLVKREIRALE